MKRIFIPFFAAAALLASCSDWTEAEHKDFLPPMNQNDPAFLTSLRDFKVGEHLVTMMIVRGTSTAPNRQNQHPMSMPDSVDYLLMTDVDDLHPALSTRSPKYVRRRVPARSTSWTIRQSAVPGTP